MTIEAIQAICLGFPGATEDIKWEDRLAFSVCDKMFMITVPDEVPQRASFKATEEEFEELISREGIVPSQFLGKHKWVRVNDIKVLSKKEWAYYIGQSYQLITAKLPAKKRKELGL
jgi:predicted DNA-binding protein (MmcQ/YjbR family)